MDEPEGRQTPAAARRSNLADEYISAAYEDEYKNWVCDEKSLGAEELKVKCRRPKNGGQKLKFFWGA